MSLRNSQNPHHVHEARRPEHVTDENVDQTTRAYEAIVRGDYKGRRSRDSSASPGATIDRLLSEVGSIPSALPQYEQSAATGAASPSQHPRRGSDCLVSEAAPGETPARRAWGSTLAPQDSTDSRNSPEPPPAFVRAHLKRTALVPSVLTVPCEMHGAAAGEYCFNQAARGVCWRRVKERVATR